jgi:imidazole glycerol-phosphate synthase subunit HisH
MGNLRSVLNALEHHGHEGALVRTYAQAVKAEKLILPGVGAFGVGMENLDRLGLADALPRLVEGGKLLLGICLGMQLLASAGSEHGEHAGLGLIPGRVDRIETGDGLRIPHVGWNELRVKRSSPVLDGLDGEPSFYFVHSYEFRPKEAEAVTATTVYGKELTACVQGDGVYGVQFHPEKSQAEGLRVLENFLTL